MADYDENPPELDGVPDLSQLFYLEMPNVVHNLKCRYEKKEIYTSVSSILIALNPYEDLECYGKETMEVYSAKERRAKVQPHIFDVAENAFRELDQRKTNQALIVCGESGAGKSESAKLLMKHLAYTTSKGMSERGEAKASKAPRGMLKRSMSKRTLSRTGSQRHVISKSHSTLSSFMELGEVVEDIHADDGVESKVLAILACNPILEAFGNAKTVFNNNSSRFGKFTKLLFTGGESSEDEHSHISGSTIETFLLEASRVVIQNKGERNYHVFYQMMAGLDKKIKDDWGLSDIQKYHYCNQSGCYELPDSPSDADGYKGLVSAMRIAHFSEDEINGVQKVLAAILHLGNVEFKVDAKDACSVDKKTAKHVRMMASLLRVDKKALNNLLTIRHLKVGSKVYDKPFSSKGAKVNRDSTAKSLYRTLFAWLVKHINNSLKGEAQENELFIGILDVFGFECFEKNSFEQLCINLANERLQAFFNTHIVLSEQAEYIREAVFWVPVSIPDNKEYDQGFTQSLFGPSGVGKKHPFIKQASEAGGKGKKKATGGTKKSLKSRTLASRSGAARTRAARTGTGRTSATSPRSSATSPRDKKLGGVIGALKKRSGGTKLGLKKRGIKNFVNGILIKHYAKDVVYDAKEFVTKNNEKVSDDLSKTMAMSSDSLVIALSKTFSQTSGTQNRSSGSAKSSTSAKKSTTKKSPLSARKLPKSGVSSPRSARGSAAMSPRSNRTSKPSLSRMGSFRSPKAKKAQPTVGGEFCNQLKQLMEELEKTQPFFIRCIKPNLEKKKLWKPELVTSQLRSGGLIQALKIIKLGYPARVEFQTLYDRYQGILQPRPKNLNERDFAEALMTAFGVRASQIAVGLTKIFFRENCQDLITKLVGGTVPVEIDEKTINAVRRHLIRKKFVRSMATVKAVARFQSVLKSRATNAWSAIQAGLRAAIFKKMTLHSIRDAKVALKTNFGALIKSRNVVLELVGTQISTWLVANNVPCSPATGIETFRGLSNGVVLLRLLNRVLDMSGAEELAPRTPAPPGSVNARANIRLFVAEVSAHGLDINDPMSPEDLSLLAGPKKLCNLLAAMSVGIGLTNTSHLKPMPIVKFAIDEHGLDPSVDDLELFSSRHSGGILDAPVSKDKLDELKSPGSVAKRRAADAEKARQDAANAAAERKASEERKKAAEDARKAEIKRREEMEKAEKEIKQQKEHDKAAVEQETTPEEAKIAASNTSSINAAGISRAAEIVTPPQVSTPPDEPLTDDETAASRKSPPPPPHKSGTKGRAPPPPRKPDENRPPPPPDKSQKKKAPPPPPGMPKSDAGTDKDKRAGMNKAPPPPPDRPKVETEGDRTSADKKSPPPPPGKPTTKGQPPPPPDKTGDNNTNRAPLPDSKEQKLPPPQKKSDMEGKEPFVPAKKANETPEERAIRRAAKKARKKWRKARAPPPPAWRESLGSDGLKMSNNSLRAKRSKHSTCGSLSSIVLDTKLKVSVELTTTKSKKNRRKGAEKEGKIQAQPFASRFKLTVTDPNSGNSWTIFRTFCEIEFAYRIARAELEKDFAPFPPFPAKKFTQDGRAARVGEFLEFLARIVSEGSPMLKWVTHRMFSTKTQGKDVAQEGFIDYKTKGNKMFLQVLNCDKHPVAVLRRSFEGPVVSEFTLFPHMEVEVKRATPTVLSIKGMRNRVMGEIHTASAEDAKAWQETIRIMLKNDKVNNEQISEDARPFISTLVRVLGECKTKRWFVESGTDWKQFQPIECYTEARELQVEEKNWATWSEEMIKTEVLQNFVVGHFDRGLKMLDSDPEKTLYLEYQGLNDVAVERMCSKLIELGESAPEIWSLRLSCNSITAKGCRSLSMFLSDPNCKVQKLYVSGNAIGDSGFELIADALKYNKSLRMLVAWNCGISDEGMVHLLDALEVNNVLTTVAAEDNYFGAAMQQAILAATQANLRLQPGLDQILSVIDQVPTLNSPYSLQTLEFFFTHYFKRVIDFPENEKFKKLDVAKFPKYLHEPTPKTGQQPGPLTDFTNNVLTFCGWFFDLPKKRWRLKTERKHYESKMRKSLFAVTFRAKRMYRREETRIFSLFADTLLTHDAFLTGYVQKRFIFDIVKASAGVRVFYGLSNVDPEAFKQTFKFIAQGNDDVLTVGQFVAFASALKHFMVKLFQIFQPETPHSANLKADKLFRALKKDTEVRQFFAIKKIPSCKAFEEFFDKAGKRNRRGSIEIDEFAAMQIAAGMDAERQPERIPEAKEAAT